MHGYFWRSRVFRTWLICYLLVLLLPLCFSAVTFQHSASILTEKLQASAFSAAQQLTDLTDERMKTIFEISDAISISPVIRSLRRYTLPFTASKYYNIHQIGYTLESYIVHKPLIQQIYIHCPQLKCLVNFDHIYTKENQYDSIIEKNLHLSVENFHALTAAQHQYDLYVTDDGERLLLFKTISTSLEDNSPTLTLIMVLNHSTFASMLEDTAQTFQAQLEIQLPADCFLGAPVETPAFPITVQNNADFGAWQAADAVICRVRANYFDATIQMKVPKDVLLTDLYNQSSLFIYMLIVTIIASLGVAYSLSRYNYRPIHQLHQTVATAPVKHGSDEFQAMGHRFLEIQENCKRLAGEVDRLASQEKQRLISSILAGDLRHIPPEKQKALLDSMHGNMFVAVILEESDDQPHDSNELLQLLETQYAKACAGRCQSVALYHGGMLTILLSFAQDMDQYSAQLAARTISKQILCAENHLSDLTAYIGDGLLGLEGIHQSYLHAQVAREYTDFVYKNEKTIALYDHTMDSGQISWKEYDIVDAERQFTSRMVAGDYAAGNVLIHEIIAYYRSYDGLPMNVLRCHMFGVMNMMLNTLRSIEPDLNNAFCESGQPVNQLLSARTMQELADVIFNIIEELQRLQAERNDTMKSRLQKIEKYIAAQYFDPNLNVQQVADHFGISLPYLSREFKSAKGIGVLDYINQYRVNKAKEMIDQNDGATISEIAQRVGYSSSQTLIRIFKRYEGVTPGKYRADDKKS